MRCVGKMRLQREGRSSDAGASRIGASGPCGSRELLPGSGLIPGSTLPGSGLSAAPVLPGSGLPPLAALPGSGLPERAA
jgi:hypothetical protein